MVSKTLILMETSKARSILCGAPRYDSFEFGREFNEIKQFIEENGLTGEVKFAITEMTLDELLVQKKEVFEEDISNLNSAITRLRTLENVNIPEVRLPPGDFDLVANLKPKLSQFINDNNISLIKIENEKKASVLDKLILRVIKIERPFRQGKDNRCEGQGFKDAVIWETFVQSNLIANYQNIILFTNDSDFDGCENEVENTGFKIIKSKEFLIQELSSIYNNEILKKKYESKIENDYFKNSLKQCIATELGSTLDSITIADLIIKVIDDKKELTKQFISLNEDETYFEDMLGIISKINVNEIEYIISTLFDLNSNEIEKIQIENNNE